MGTTALINISPQCCSGASEKYFTACVLRFRLLYLDGFELRTSLTWSCCLHILSCWYYSRRLAIKWHQEEREERKKKNQDKRDEWRWNGLTWRYPTYAVVEGEDGGDWSSLMGDVQHQFVPCNYTDEPCILLTDWPNYVVEIYQYLQLKLAGALRQHKHSVQCVCHLMEHADQRQFVLSSILHFFLPTVSNYYTLHIFKVAHRHLVSLVGGLWTRIEIWIEKKNDDKYMKI